MSAVNADGVLLNPHEAILQQVQALSNTLMAETPQGMEDDQEHTVFAGNGEAAGTVGGAPHIPPETVWQTRMRWAWWRQRDWWGPSSPPTPW